MLPGWQRRVVNKLAHLPVDITLIDRTNHHLFQPLLYQVATGELSEGQIAPALRGMFRGDAGVRVIMGEVDGLDLEHRSVHAFCAGGDDRLTLPYDTLVIAAGSVDSYFGTTIGPEWVLSMKTLDDAQWIRAAFSALSSCPSWSSPAPSAARSSRLRSSARR